MAGLRENGGNCVEVAPGCTDVVPVRDSKNPDGPVMVDSRSAWAAFTATRVFEFRSHAR
ncbi:DUF397 domain-containing protein [Streptomyces sp. WAC 04229]|uniref:DUF397 domain-containing protein n=1 Tax=Streptomyces sp. WAC 04229 TaxID=2203206 RepID=UPI003D73E396